MSSSTERSSICGRKGVLLALGLAVAAGAAMPSAASAGLLSKASADQNRASGSAIELGDGLVVVGGSRATGGSFGGAEWNAAEVNGISLLRHEASPSGTKWSGLAAALGPALDELNRNGCVRDVAGQAVCVIAGGRADRFAGSDSSSSSAFGNLVELSAGSLETGYAIVRVGESGAFTSNHDYCPGTPGNEIDNGGSGQAVGYEVYLPPDLQRDGVDRSEAQYETRDC